MKLTILVTPANAGAHPGKVDSRFRGNDMTFERVSMGLWPTQGNENPHRRRPREGGDPRWVDSRFRGDDVVGAIFRRAKQGIPLCFQFNG